MGDSPPEDGNEHINDSLVSSIAQVLDISPDDVRASPEATFIQLGGDSIRALQLTFQLDSQDLTLELESVLAEGNTVKKLSKLLEDGNSIDVEAVDKPQREIVGSSKSPPAIPPASLDSAVREAIDQAGIPEYEIEQLLPTSSQQKLLWLGSLQQSGAYIAHWCFHLPENLDLARFRRAWLDTVAESHVLRARFILDRHNNLIQAIMAHSTDSSLWTDNMKDLGPIVPEYGKPLVRMGIETEGQSTKFHLFAHHAVYDRWSMQLILDDVRRRYSQKEAPSQRPSFAPVLESIATEQQDQLRNQWRAYFGDSSYTPVPELASELTSSRQPVTIQKTIKTSSQSATKAELITAAWSWICSKQSNNTDVSFGLTLSGRDLPVKGINNMAFPTFRTLPVCARLEPGVTVHDLMSATKETLRTLRSLQALSFDDIATLNNVSRLACRFNSVVVIQTQRKSPSAFDRGDILTPESLSSFELQQGNQVLLECTPSGDEMHFSLSFNPDLLAETLAEPLLSQFCITLQALSSDDTRLCSDIDLFSQEDESQIREWIRPCEERQTCKMYTRIQGNAKASPDASAIWTTQGITTYGQLMKMATDLCHTLQKESVSGHVGICYERSTAAVVAQIGVSMAGCAYVPMEPSNPSARLEQIVQDSRMRLLICSKSLLPKFEGFDVPILVLHDTSLHGCEWLRTDNLERSQEGTDTAYIVYTSGSTGKPKGVIIQHEQIATSLSAQSKFMNMSKDSRTLQFSSLAFDMSVHEIYMTLFAGGTVCIPTDAERFELDDFLAQARCNYSMLTPSVAATLSDKSLAQISDISLCGEPIHQGMLERVAKAGSHPWIIYGPTETTVVVLGHKAKADTNRFNLGYSFGATAWIVDADEPHKLAPFGTQGQLAFSGYTLAAGYFEDPEKTDAAFRKGLKWTSKFPNHPLDRVYLTGDLARYNQDGTITFLGRLGGYTKIAGNRVDLDEIRHVLNDKGKLRDTSVLICRIKGDEGKERDMLLCFFANAPSSSTADAEDCRLLDFDSIARSKASTARGVLEQNLPAYMMPSAFIPVNKIPLSTSGKLDAATLRNLVGDLDVQQLLTSYAVDDDDPDANDRHQDAKSDGETARRREILIDAWSAVLSLPSRSLNDRSHFVRLGGDSLRAMELGAKVRLSGLRLHVADIVKTPILGQMLKCLHEQEKAKPKRATLSKADHEELVKGATEALQVPWKAIESVSLCSSLQSQIMVASERSKGSFLHRDCFRITSRDSDEEVQEISRSLMEQHELLRTRIYVDTTSGRFAQAVVSCDQAFDFRVRTTDVREYIQESDASPLGMGTALCRFTLLKNGEETPILVWEMHHSIYDGHSHILLLNSLHGLLDHKEGEANQKESRIQHPTAKYQDFLDYLATVDKEDAHSFWTQYLDGVEKPIMSILSPVPKDSQTNAREEANVQLSWKQSEFTTATYIRTAFALVLSRYASSKDVTFAVTVNGRDLPVDGIEEIVGPTFATIPVRTKINANESIRSLLSRTQSDSTECAAQQALPIEDMRQINSSCKAACDFNVHLLVQTQDMAQPYERLTSLGYKVMQNVSPMELGIPFNIVATGKGDGLHLEAIYNDAAIGAEQVNLVLDQLGALIRQLIASDNETIVRDVFCLGEQNIELLMAMQTESAASLPEASTIPDLVWRQSRERAHDEAIYSSDFSLTYQELWACAHELAERIAGKLGGDHQLVAFCFDKSPWAIVAQLAILIAGHAFVPIDPSWTESRRKDVLDQTQSPLVMTSPKLAETFARSSISTLTFDGKHDSTRSEKLQQAQLKPTDLAYILFTSGSTGKPKGVVVEHGSISRTIQSYAERLNFSSDTRALLFASFTFDASIMETWSVLAAGGTLCVANDHERIADLSDFITKSRCDCVGLTPSAAGLLVPTELRNLKTLLFCGEKCRESELKPWRETDVTLVNAYGPTEACVNAATNVQFRDTDLDDIGTSLGGGLWITSLNNVNELLPVDCVGELVITGPILAREYFHAPDINAKRFVYPQWPEWTNIQHTKAFRTGDLARFDSNGRLHFVGRNDGQMKVRGMRVEAEEIEGALYQANMGAKEIIVSTFSQNDDANELAAFFVPGDLGSDVPAFSILPLGTNHAKAIANMRSAAEKVLSAAFVPSFYIPVTRIPLSTSGKADRKLLAQSASNLHPIQLSVFGTSDGIQAVSSTNTEPKLNGTAHHSEPLTEREEMLGSIWRTVLRHGPDSAQLNRDSHFVEAGGDSVAAIRLAAVAKSKGLALPVSAIYSNPRLGDMAQAMDEGKAKKQRTKSVHTPAPFELLDGIEITSPDAVGDALTIDGVSQGMGKDQGDYFGVI